MPKEIYNALTPAKVKQEKRPGLYADGNGLYLVVSDSGARWWQWRGTVHGRRRELGMGSARLFSLAEARETARTWRRIAKAGGDPKVERDKDKRQLFTFEAAARQVWADQVKGRGKNEKYSKQWIGSLEAYAFPLIGSRPVHAVAQSDVLRVLSPIWIEKPETARGWCASGFERSSVGLAPPGIAKASTPSMGWRMACPNSETECSISRLCHMMNCRT